jgi:hypothetical protein
VCEAASVLSRTVEARRRGRKRRTGCLGEYFDLKAEVPVYRTYFVKEKQGYVVKNGKQ